MKELKWWWDQVKEGIHFGWLFIGPFTVATLLLVFNGISGGTAITMVFVFYLLHRVFTWQDKQFDAFKAQLDERANSARRESDDSQDASKR